MTLGSPPSQADPAPRQWWQERWFVAALILLSAVPLLYPAIPPLVDLPGHMGRYRVELDLANSPELQRYFSFQWQVIGNLGVDLLVVPLSRIFGLELAVKLIVLAIPPLTVAGFLWVAREVHNRLPPTVLFALPFAFGHPFMFGFVNYALSMALAFLAFGLWLRLAKLGRLKLRALLFVPISCLVWLTHTFGWGILGLLCFSAEAVRQHDRGSGWILSAWRAAYQALALALPIVPTLAWRNVIGGAPTGDWFNWSAKLSWLTMALRDRWHWFDVASILVVVLVLIYALLSRRLTFSRHLGFSTLILAIAYIAMPRIVFGSAYADMRLVPFVLAMTIMAIRFKGATDLKLARILTLLGLIFYLGRTAATTYSLAIAGKDQSIQLAVLDQVPRGARLVNIVSADCASSWALARNAHLGAMAIVRRHAFSNDQWIIEGSNLLSVHFPEAGRFTADPSQFARPTMCVRKSEVDLARSLGSIPAGAFDYLWLINAPSVPKAWLAGWTPVHRAPRSILLRRIKAPIAADVAPPPATLRTATAPGP